MSKITMFDPHSATVMTSDISIKVMHNFEKAAQKFFNTKDISDNNKSLRSLTVLMTISLIGSKLIVINLSQ